MSPVEDKAIENEAINSVKPARDNRYVFFTTIKVGRQREFPHGQQLLNSPEPRSAESSGEVTPKQKDFVYRLPKMLSEGKFVIRSNFDMSKPR